jgi:hypothetical protein
VSATFLSLLLCSVVFVIIIGFVGVSNIQDSISGTVSLSANATVWNAVDIVGGVTQALILVVIAVIVLSYLICRSISNTSLAEC